MLENFEQAKEELARIRDALTKHIANEGNSAELEFMKARALDRLQDIYVDSKFTIDHIKATFKDAQASFEEHARMQRKGFDDAATAAQKSVEGIVGDVNRAAAQAITSMNSAQANASQYLQVIGAAQEGAAKQATETARISNAVSQLQTEIHHKV